MAKHNAVERLLFNIDDLSQEEKDELVLKILDQGYDKEQESKTEAGITPLTKGVNPEDFEKRYKDGDKVSGVSTGYWSLDRMTAGLVGGELIVVAAGTGIGKTNLCVNMMARQLVIGYKCLFISLENSKESIRRRLRSIMGKENYYEIVNTGNLFVQKSMRFPYESVKYAVEDAKAKGVEIVYIDHLQFFMRGMKNPVEEIGIITKELKTVAMEKNIPIVLVSQLRRLAQDEVVDEHALRGSGFIEQDADTIIILNKNKEDFDQKIEIKLCKKRDRVLWKNYSTISYSQFGYDLEEPVYSEIEDKECDVKGLPRGKGSIPISFRDKFFNLEGL